MSSSKAIIRKLKFKIKMLEKRVHDLDEIRRHEIERTNHFLKQFKQENDKLWKEYANYMLTHTTTDVEEETDTDTGSDSD